MVISIFILAVISKFGGTTDLNKICPAPALCADLEKNYLACRFNTHAKECLEFIQILKHLSPIYDCSRSFDRGHVPAIWLCGQNRRKGGASYDEAYYNLLSKLRLKEAKEYFASPLFRSVLDGAMAEEYYERSEKLESIILKKTTK